MVTVDFEEHIATKRFEYGNHEIVIDVFIDYGRCINRRSSDIINKNKSRHKLSHNDYYYRNVEIKAYGSNGELNVKNESHVALDAEYEKKITVRKRIFKSNKTKTVTKNKTIPIREQIFKTAEPIFNSLDKMYRFTKKDISIDVDVATEEVSAETSWVEVEDDIDGLSQEIDNLTA